MKRGSLRIVLALFVLAAVQGGYRATLAQGQLTLAPFIGAPGSVVALNAPPGSLPGNSIAEVDFVDATGLYVGLPLARIQINADGSITNFPVTIVPQAAAGTARIFVTSAGISISAPFVVRPGISVSPSVSQQKLPVAVSGSGFNSNATITFSTLAPDGTFQPAAVAGDPLVIATALGTFSAMIVVPRGTPKGTLEVAATDGTYTATTTLQIMDPAALTSPAVPGTATTTAPGTVSPTPPSTPTPQVTPALATTAYFAEGYTGQAATNGRASFTETLNILNPSSSAAQATITYIIQGSVTPLVLTRTIAPSTVLREPVNADVGPDKQVAAIVSSAQRLVVSRAITRTAAEGTRLDGSASEGARAPSTTWGFPEGYTGFSFQEYLTLLNPGTATATAHVTLAPQGNSASAAQTLNLTVPPMSRVTANIRALNAASKTKSVGMLISSDQPIVAERVEYFGDGAGSGKFGSTVSSGITAPATLLYAGYGNVTAGPAGNEQYLTLLNPSSAAGPVTVTIRAADAGGHTLGTTSVTVFPGTRKTVAASALAGSGPATLFSATLQATGPIEAESAQYFGGSPNSGTHPGVAFPALPAAGGDQFLSDISTQLPDGTPVTRTLYLYNPGATAVMVAATYFGASGNPVRATYTVPAGGIIVVPVNQAVSGQLAAGALGAELTVAGGSGVIASAVGVTGDGRSATEDMGVSP
ncbi:MAG TPA: hypothetical protein VHB98_08210 [Chloroflexota bacterium]|nr:hypothetical protein [Chloroflexota bacterium]